MEGSVLYSNPVKITVPLFDGTVGKVPLNVTEEVAADEVERFEYELVTTVKLFAAVVKFHVELALIPAKALPNDESTTAPLSIVT